MPLTQPGDSHAEYAVHAPTPSTVRTSHRTHGHHPQHTRHQPHHQPHHHPHHHPHHPHQLRSPHSHHHHHHQHHRHRHHHHNHPEEEHQLDEQPRSRHRNRHRHHHRHHHRHATKPAKIDPTPLPNAIAPPPPPPPPRPPPVAPGLHVYADSKRVRKGGELRAGYGVSATLHNVRIAEPLPGRDQSSSKAELASLHAALQLLCGVRPRIAIVHVRGAHTVRMFNDEGVSASFPVRSRRLWCAVRAQVALLRDRGVSLTVIAAQFADPDPDLRLASRLARHGAALHVTCPLCRCAHGRQWSSHVCRPICERAPCAGERFATIDLYFAHVQAHHATTCPYGGCAFVVLHDDTHDQGRAQLLAHLRTSHHTSHHTPMVGDAGTAKAACPHCGVKCNGPRALQQHIGSACARAPECTRCGRRFVSAAELHAHMARRSTAAERRHTGVPARRPKPLVGDGLPGYRSEDREYSVSESVASRHRSQASHSFSENDADSDRDDDDADDDDDDDSQEDDDVNDEEEDSEGMQGAVDRLLMTDRLGHEWEVDDFGGLRSTSLPRMRTDLLDRHSE